MTIIVVKALLGLGLWQVALAVSPTTTSSTPPSPTNTYCPQYFVTPLADHGAYTCGVKGFVTEPGFLSQPCNLPLYGYGSYDELDCYRRCSSQPDCKSFAYDPVHAVCTNYGKSLKDKGFQASENGTLHYDLHGCFACNEPAPVPVRPGCGDFYTRIRPKKKGYTCETNGYVTDDTYVAIYYNLDQAEDCYNRCVQFDSVGECKSFAFAYNTEEELSVCKIFNTSLYKKGFQKSADGSGMLYWNLRGCFKCDIPPPPIPMADSNGECPRPSWLNGDFSETVYNSQYNVTQPAGWQCDPNIKSVTGPTGNTYLSVDAPPSHLGYGHFTQTTVRFNTNALSELRYYDLTFDMAVIDYYRPPNATEHGCYVQPYWTTQPYTFTGLQLKNYGPNFTTVGPWTFNFENTGGQVLIGIATLCEEPHDYLYYAEHGTVLFDNFVWSQNGVPVVFT